jgi:hypothetical protein
VLVLLCLALTPALSEEVHELNALGDSVREKVGFGFGSASSTTSSSFSFSMGGAELGETNDQSGANDPVPAPTDAAGQKTVCGSTSSEWTVGTDSCAMLFAKQTNHRLDGSSHIMQGQGSSADMTCVSNVPQAISALSGTTKTAYQTAFDTMRTKVCNGEAAATRPSCCGQSAEADKCSAHICYKGVQGGEEVVYGHNDNIPLKYDGGWHSTSSKLTAKIEKAIFCLNTGDSARPQICATSKKCHTLDWDIQGNEPKTASYTAAKNAKVSELITMICSTV